MAELFNIQLESDLSEFTSTATDSGDLSWSADAALAGTSGGMALLIDDQTSIYGIKDLASASTSGVLRLRFYIDPNSLTMANTNEFYLTYIRSSAAANLAYIYLRFITATGYDIRVACIDDDNVSNYSSYYSITDEPHYIEIKIVRATDVDDSDGSLQLWIDGVDKATISGIDNYDQFADFDYLRIGAATGVDADTSGTFYIDEIVANDDGGEIGPVAPSTLSVSKADGLTLGETSSPAMSDMGVDIASDNAAYQGTGVRVR